MTDVEGEQWADVELPFDAGDQKQVKVRKTKAQLERELQVEEMRVILSTKGGRNVIWRVFCMSKLFCSPPGEDHACLRAVGRQDLGRELLAEVFTSDAKAFILMQSEADERDNKIGKR